MRRKHNTRSIKKIEETYLDRIDYKRKLEQIHGKIINNQPTEGQGWSFIPADR
jgi:hypothetical protein